MTAVLGPTNTGKTYLAIERMLGYRTGMIGFPLRLLARENYDKVVRIAGARAVALVTGEEKIVPPTARYFMCTVEAMPIARLVDFLAIDEVQLCADPERGHVFTDRLLRARGQLETMFLGADTIRPVIRTLVPETTFISRPRFSRLTYAGPRKLSRIPRRSAVVAFAANDVYALAETIRRARGGAAVVLGALSPRTRNAQVEMYQQGEVDYLVATDAIGMGLNMDIGHVAFSGLRKFDGHRHRMLAVDEIAQIAGRAGRYMSDGTFGTLADIEPLEPEAVDAIENHHFRALRGAWWRNTDLSFRSLGALRNSLDAPPPSPALMRAHTAEDHLALNRLAEVPEIAALAGTPDMVRLLWETCQIPDFRKTMAEDHVRLIGRVFRFLARGDGRLPYDWVANQLVRLDRADGDIDTLMARIAHTRTWTYVSQRGDWLDDAAHWQGRARAIEDRLSDALHDRLTQRFVDRRSTALIRSRSRSDLAADIDSEGAVRIEGDHVGWLDGFRFEPEDGITGETRRLVLSAAKRTLGAEIRRRIEALEGDADDAFGFADDGAITWRGAVVARLGGESDVMAPSIRLTASDLLPAQYRRRAELRLRRWLTDEIDRVLGPLIVLERVKLSGPARGLVFRLREGLGSMPRAKAAQQITALTAEDRQALRRRGLRLGRDAVFLPALLKPRAVRLRALLWAARHPGHDAAPPAPGRVSAPAANGVPNGFYEAIGYRVIDGHAMRIDVLDRIAVQLLRLARKGPFAPPADIAPALGVGVTLAGAVVAALGYRQRPDDGLFQAKRRDSGRKGSRVDGAGAKSPRPRAELDGDSPFASLARLRLRQ
ncbi:MAG: helicase-related protein [Alphaproteobacteria bacterium]